MKLKTANHAEKAKRPHRMKHSILMYLFLLFVSAFLLLVVAYLQEVAYAQGAAQLFHVEHSMVSAILNL